MSLEAVRGNLKLKVTQALFQIFKGQSAFKIPSNDGNF